MLTHTMTVAKKAGRLAMGAVLGLAAASAQADTLSAPNLIGSKSEAVSVTYAPAGLNNSQFNAGTFSVSLNGGPAFEAYCVDLFHFTAGSYQVNPQSMAALSGIQSVVAGGGTRAGWLYDNFAASVNSSAKGAGLQLAIWEALYDPTPYSLSGGAFVVNSASSGALSQANGYLTALAAAIPGGLTTAAIWFEATAHPNGTNQNLMGVPEPSSVVLVGLGLAGAIGLTWRQRARLALA